MMRRGMSLIEVVLSIVILGLTVPAMVLQLHSAIAAQTAARVQGNLVMLADARINEIFADRRDPTRGYGYIAAGSYPDEEAPAGLDRYMRQTEIREVDPADLSSPQGGSGIKRIRVTVTGPDDGMLQVETFVADVGGVIGG